MSRNRQAILKRVSQGSKINICVGKALVDAAGATYSYKGFVLDGRACGVGTAIQNTNSKNKFDGLFFDNKPHGICKCSHHIDLENGRYSYNERIDSVRRRDQTRGNLWKKNNAISVRSA